MTSRDQLVQQVLHDLQEAVESEGLEGLISAALEAKQVLSSFTLPIYQKGGPGAQVLEVDSVALSLYPEDAPRNMLPLVCKGEGSLLFEAASMLLWGHIGLSLELRARTVVEMLLHKHYYLQGMIDSKVMLQAVRYSLCSEATPEMTNLSFATLEAIFDADVKATCFPTSFSNVWHLYALASILERNIYSIYPMRNVKIRPYFNRVIMPRCSAHVTSMLHIMWAGQPLASHLFRHQYFAPVVGLEEVEADGNASRKAVSRAPLTSQGLISPKMPLSRWQRRLRRAARKQVLSGHLPFCRFRLRYPSLLPSTFWVWKSLSRGWPRMQAPSLGRKKQKPEGRQKPVERQAMEAVQNVTPVVVPPAETLPVAASLENTPEDARGGPSREGIIQEAAMAQGQPHRGSLPSQTMAMAPGGRDGQVLVMDMLTTTRFKAQAKLFLQKRFQSKTFPSYKEFQALFPLTARSTYYMWKRALYEGLTLVDG
ncbi:vertnin [Mastomys coucha]|uniref:vertnin n=1 Tax=Mastomys coucha TaxID=35658 RepID=UPI0012625FC8|nr:vertnin [Mastomys coucha]